MIVSVCEWATFFVFVCMYILVFKRDLFLCVLVLV